MHLPITIYKTHPDAITPHYATPGSCAFDLAIIEDTVIQPGEVVRLRTGLVLCVPDGYVLFISARSSMPRKHGLSIPQGFGLIDNDFCGPNDELLLQVLNFTNQPVEVKKGDRLMQGIFLPRLLCTFNEVDQLDTPSRGGFGSTGR